MSFDCEVTQQTFRQMGLDFAKVFGQQLAKQPVKQAQQAIFDEDDEDEIDPNEFDDESDDPFWYDDDGSIYSQD